MSRICLAGALGAIAGVALAAGFGTAPAGALPPADAPASACTALVGLALADALRRLAPAFLLALAVLRLAEALALLPALALARFALPWALVSVSAISYHPFHAVVT